MFNDYAHIANAPVLCINSSFTPLLFKSLGAGSAAFGFALLLNCSAEVPCFVISSRIPNAYFARLMTAGLAAGAVRLAFYASMPAWAKPDGAHDGFGIFRLLIAEPLNGLHFAVFWTGAPVTYASRASFFPVGRAVRSSPPISLISRPASLFTPREGHGGLALDLLHIFF